MVRDPRNPIVSCVADPRTGHEWDQPTIMNFPPVSRRVAIVGGGPAGLEAARVAGTRGHSVRVFEQSARLGGAFPAAAAGAGRERLALLTDWLAAECRHLGVEFELGTRADADLLRGLGADVILATGSLERHPHLRRGRLRRRVGAGQRGRYWRRSRPEPSTRCRPVRRSSGIRSAARSASASPRPSSLSGARSPWSLRTRSPGTSCPAAETSPRRTTGCWSPG